MVQTNVSLSTFKGLLETDLWRMESEIENKNRRIDDL